NAETAHDLLVNADTALYHAKREDRNSFKFYLNEMNDKVFERQRMEVLLRNAIIRNELVVHYQPKIDIQSSRVVGAEALVRWFNPELGMVPPSEFIPLAEETGLIHDIGNWVAEQACYQNTKWIEEGFLNLCMSINVSGLQFAKEDFVEKLASILDKTSMPAS